MNKPFSILVSEWAEIRASLQASGLFDDDPILLRDTLDGSAEAMDVVAAFIKRAREDDVFAAAVRGLAGEYRERAERLDHRAEKGRAAAHRLMDAIGEKRVERPEFTVTIAAGRPSVKVMDAAEVPDEFCRIKREPSKTLIAEAMDRGEHVPGAYRTNGEPHILVRVV